MVGEECSLGSGMYFDLSRHCQEGLFYVCCVLG
jgi:hypothetical protein